VRAVADRHTGIGCDQLILIEPPVHQLAEAVMRIVNADGSEAEACGNAARCVAWLLGQETGQTRVRIETVAGLLDAELLADDLVAVDMGPVRTDWRDIPLARRMETLSVNIAAGPLARPVCCNIGNPHATFFVRDTDEIDLGALGPIIESDRLFPERINVGVATVQSPDQIRLRVWERGAGITRACGTGACAALVAAHRRGLTGRQATVALDGGDLEILWRDDEDAHVIMIGPATLAFEGSFDAELFGR